MSIEMWLFVFAFIQTVCSVFAGLQFFGITPSHLVVPMKGKAWLVIMAFLWLGGIVFTGYGMYQSSTNLELKTDMIDSLEKEKDKFKNEINALKAAGPKELPPPPVQDYKKFQSDKLEQIVRRTFINETVELDGKSFEECTFNNVTLVYNGLGPTWIISPRWQGNTILQTHNAGIKMWAKLSAIIRHLPGVEAVVEGEKDESGKLHILTKDLRMPLSKEAKKKEDTSTKKQYSK